MGCSPFHTGLYHNADTPAFSGYSVDDITKAKEFYGTTLGIEIEESGQGLELKLKGAGNVFLYPKPNHTPASFTVLNFAVEDIGKTAEELRAKGIKFEIYEQMPQPDSNGIYRPPSRNQGPDIAWFKDPAGNVLSVLQM